MAKGFLSFAALIAAAVGTLPLVLAAYLLGDAWVWLGLPLGVAYGTVAYVVGVRVAGAILDRRMPELLATVTPNR
jgi:ABC-2 type transport system permease protein